MTAKDIRRPDADERYIEIAELRRLLGGKHDMTIRRWQKDPRVELPAPTQVLPNGRRIWWLPDIQAWLARRKSGEAA